MIQQENNGWTRAILPIVSAALLLAVGLTPAGSSAYSQRRTARRSQSSQSRQQPSVYGRGYLNGYNEAFGQGQTDSSRGMARDFQRSDAYQRRDRSYEQGQGPSNAYTQGYQLGFELGYIDGYYGRTRNSAVPVNAENRANAAALTNADRAREQELAREQQLAKDQQAARDQQVARDQQAARDNWDRRGDLNRTRSSDTVTIPDDTEIRLRLTTPINTRTNRAGDRFRAVVLPPSGFFTVDSRSKYYEGATVEGHIATLSRSGRINGKTELALAFDSITLADGRHGPLNADLEKILESETVKKVDEEGRIESGNRTRDTEVRGGVGAGAGALIGGLIGGGKGAIIGLLVGGAAGVGTVYVEGNNDLILDNGTEMVIRTAGRRQQ